MARIRSEYFNSVDPDFSAQSHIISMSLREIMYWTWRVKKIRLQGSWETNVVSSNPGDIPRFADFDFESVSTCVNEIDILSNFLTYGEGSATEYTEVGEADTVQPEFLITGAPYHTSADPETDNWYLRLLLDLKAYAARISTSAVVAGGGVLIPHATYPVLLRGYDAYYGVQYEHEVPIYIYPNTLVLAGSCTIEAVEFWPYEDSNGNAIYDTTTGAVLPGKTPHIGP